jgi:hypothetical protein
MGNGDMRPGDVRVFRNRGSAVLAIGIWPKRRGRQLHIDITGPKEFFHTTITNDPNSDRYRRTLFRDLRRVLVEADCWPYGEEGAETADRTTR